MLSFIWALSFALLKALGIALAIYIFYWRVWDYFRAVYFYKSQGEHVLKFGFSHVPIFGHAYMLAWSAWKSHKEGDNYFIMKHAFDSVPKDAGTLIAFISNGAGLGIRDVKVVEAMYTTKNKYFDKHPIIKDLALPLTGESILFAETSDDWRKSRKAMSPAFYKGKLENLVEVGKQAVQTTLDRFKQIASQGPRSEVDIMDEIGLMTSRILLVCAFGVDCADDMVDFWENGQKGQKSVAYSLRVTFSNLVNRLVSPHINFFPMLARYHITPFERDQGRNAKALRDFCQTIIDKRRDDIKRDPELAKAGDFLTILLTEEHFKDRTVRIIDECLTFFFAGSQTSSVATQNLIFALCKHPEYQDKILAELDQVIIQPHLKELHRAGRLSLGETLKDLDILSLINYENNGDLQLYANCFNESLRMQPPVYYSSSVRMSETVQCEKLKIRKGDQITIMMESLCNDPKEWIEPERFIPERFDPQSRYFLTPKGQKRNPYSFSPFLGGSRICIGKTFIEVVSKLTLPTLLSHFKFEFKEGVDRESVPFMHNNMVARWMPEFKALISERERLHTLK